MRLYLVVEGQTEEVFVRNVLAPHLQDLGVFARATIVGTPKSRGSAPLRKGGGDWQRWKRDIRRVLGEQGGPDVRVSTLFDLYGLPKQFPGLSEHGGDKDTNRRCELLQGALASAFDDWRLIPYVQRHEVEALVLAALPSLRESLDATDDVAGVDALLEEVARLDPEDVDDGRESAPSKRLIHHIPGYRKTLHGPLAMEDAGLRALRDRCPRFDAWVAALEALGDGSDT